VVDLLANRYQHVLDAIRKDVANQVGGLLWNGIQMDPADPKRKRRRRDTSYRSRSRLRRRRELDDMPHSGRYSGPARVEIAQATGNPSARKRIGEPMSHKMVDCPIDLRWLEQLGLAPSPGCYVAADLFA
jgi:hypothetical protein